MTDLQTKQVFSKNVLRLLGEQGKTVHWLMVQTGANANQIYPAIRGETNVCLALVTKVARALRVTMNDIVPPEAIYADEPVELKPQKPSRRKSSRILEKIA